MMKNALLMCGILLFVLSTWASAATDPCIVEEYDNGDYLNKPMIDSGRVNSSETPQRMSGAVLGTGFTWGGLGQETWVHKGEKIATKEYAKGDYCYTIFDDTGGNSANHTINLNNGVIRSYVDIGDKDDTHTEVLKFRHMIRVGEGNWYLSDTVITHDESWPDNGGKKWLRHYGAVATWTQIINTNGVVTSLDALAAGDEREICRGASGLTPDLSLVDGAGFYFADGADIAGQKANPVVFTTVLDSVPEPATIALLGLGGLFLRRKR
jgi:hypothetical protein